MILFRPLLRYADFKGRASRAEFWLFSLLQGLWYGFLVGLVVAAMGQHDTSRAALGATIAFALIVISIGGLIVPNYSVLVRRLHDTGRGAAWLGLMAPSIASAVLTLTTLGAAVGSVGLGASRDAFLATVLAGLGTAGLLGLIGMLGQMVMGVLILLPGTRGENRFGPDPRDPTARYSEGGGGTTYDDARLEALFAEARLANQAAATPSAPAGWQASAPVGVTSAPIFGRRGA